MCRAIPLIAFVLAFAGPRAASQERVTVLRGGEVNTIASGVVANGVVVFQGGKILDVGGPEVAIPSGAEVIDAKGLLVTPGIIDARSRLGINPFDSWESSTPVAPQLRILESFFLPENHEWLREGVTGVYLTAGPENVLGGVGAVVKLAGRPRDFVVSESAGLSGSLGEVPKQSFGQQAPRTRMGSVYLIRDALVRAREYGQAEAHRDLGLEALGRVLRREVPLRVQANTPDDIMNALRLAKEFDLRLVIDVGVGAHRVADKLAAAGVPVVVGPNMVGAGGGGRFEFAEHTEENAARLHRAGVKIAFGTDDDGGRSVVLEAAVSRAHGLPEAEALRAITLSAAEILGVSDRLGSIEKGKDADLVLWKGHPLSTWGRTERVFVSGLQVFERRDKSP